MRLRRSVGFEGALRAGDYSRAIGVGSVVDFDEVVSHHRTPEGAAVPMTIADHLGMHADLFAEIAATPAGQDVVPGVRVIEEHDPWPVTPPVTE